MHNKITIENILISDTTNDYIELALTNANNQLAAAYTGSSTTNLLNFTTE